MSQTPIVRVVFFNISCFAKKTQARMVKDEKSGGKKHTYTIDEKGGYKNPQPPILDLQCPSSQVPKCPSAQVYKCPSAQVHKCTSARGQSAQTWRTMETKAEMEMKRVKDCEVGK